MCVKISLYQQILIPNLVITKLAIQERREKTNMRQIPREMTFLRPAKYFGGYDAH